MKYLLKNGRVWSKGKGIKRDLYIEGDKIVTGFAESEADRIIDAQGLEIFPGFVDLHCHLREPGFSVKETVQTGTKAAAKGGFTTVLAMPNTKPVLDSVWEMENFLRYLEDQAIIRVLPVAPLTKGRLGQQIADLASLGTLGIKFASDDGNDLQSAALMKNVLAYASDHNYTVLSHAEESSLSKGYFHAGYLMRDYGIPGIPSSSEAVAVARNMLLAKEVGARIHFCHLSARESVYLIRLGKELGINLTAEVTPHHLFYADSDVIPFDTTYKVNPPLREIEDRNCLREALKSGLIDVVATDHAPHTHKEKEESISEAPFGISSIEIAASIVHTIYLDPKIIYARFCEGPYRILGEENDLCENQKADVTVFDSQWKIVVNQENWVSLGKNNPYFGHNLQGKVLLTIKGGQIVYEQS